MKNYATHGGFALIATLSILILLTVIAVGLLSLSTLSLRSSTQGAARAEAQSNARLALELAIGELQKQLGPDQNITAPSSILDGNPDTDSPDSLSHPHLTGVWQSRVTESGGVLIPESLESTPSYDREEPFQRWLVSGAEPEQLSQLSFAQSGAFEERVPMVTTTPPSGSSSSDSVVYAGKIPTRRGSFAWWVGDENCKARINMSNQLDRGTIDESLADLLASFATPGPHGPRSLPALEKFETNSEDSDKQITRNTLDLADDITASSSELFHDITPWSNSVLTSVTSGTLRQDLNLFLERDDIDWEQDWPRPSRKSPQGPKGPLGPNDQYALSTAAEFDVLPWKALHHYYNMHRNLVFQSPGLHVDSINGLNSINPITNPEWNSGVNYISPIVVRIQMLISYSTELIAKASATKSRYRLLMHAYPVLTVWNPFNVGMNVDQFSVFLHTIPLEHKFFVGDNQFMITSGSNPKTGAYNWDWPLGNMTLRVGPESSLYLKPGEARALTYRSSKDAEFHAHDMTTQRFSWSPDRPGQARDLGIITASPDERIRIETTASTWENSNTSYKVQQFQTTFDFRTEGKKVHTGHGGVWKTQLFSSQVAWRHEAANPAAAKISKENFPGSSLSDLDRAPSPIIHLDVRLKTLDEEQLPNKTWFQCMPSHPYAAATSTQKHSSRGVDASTTFFAHPFSVTFNQVSSEEGLFSRVPYFGTSHTPSGQTFITDREAPLVPLTSLAQLQNLPQNPIEGLNWSGYYMQNHAIGNSYASPGLESDQIKERSFPFYLGQYFAWQGGDITGGLHNRAGFNNDEWSVGIAPASVIDRSYAANHLLFDDYFFSSLAPKSNDFYEKFGSKPSSLADVAKNVFEDQKDLPNATYKPHYPVGTTADSVLEELLDSDAVKPDAYRKIAAYLETQGGFNVNSTSVAAWSIMLGSAHLKRPVFLDSNGSGNPNISDAGKFIVSRFTMPNAQASGNGSANDADRWVGYHELSADQIQQLATAIVKQVKIRGPFRSLGEFLNRRLTADEDLALSGALQAALDDPDVDINDKYRDYQLTSADLADANYKFQKAALGSRYQGTPAYVSQADLLMALAPIINARSDTFTIRAYGESISEDGTVQAKAWCEAVVQRTPAYVNPSDEPWTAARDLGSTVNKTFGRRFILKSLRWLSPAELETI
ncbi:MAG: hypothetical protein WBG04_03790 [Haloferula sp.]